MGKASAVYLRATAAELNEWLFAALDAGLDADASEEVSTLLLAASRSLHSAADRVESLSWPAGRSARCRNAHGRTLDVVADIE